MDGCAFRADGRPTDQQEYLVPRTPAMSGSGVLVDGVAPEKMVGEREWKRLTKGFSHQAPKECE